MCGKRKRVAERNDDRQRSKRLESPHGINNFRTYFMHYSQRVEVEFDDSVLILGMATNAWYEARSKAPTHTRDIATMKFKIERCHSA